MGAQRLDFSNFWGPFGHPFFIKVRDPKLLKLQETLCLLFQASHFGIKKSIGNSKIFKTRSSTNFFLMLFALMSKNWIVDPLQNQVGASWRPKSHNLHPNPARILFPPAPGCVLGTDWCCRSVQSATGVHFEWLFVDWVTLLASVFIAMGTNLISFFVFLANRQAPNLMQNTCKRAGKELRNTCNNERSPRSFVWHFEIFQATPAATNRKLQIQVAAVCAPHGA